MREKVFSSAVLVPFFLMVYHFLFTFLNWSYFVKNGGDAAYYWFTTKASSQLEFQDLFTYGSESILLFNYLFVNYFQLGIPFGFILYSGIGFLGILQFYRFGNFLLKKPPVFMGINLFWLLLLLPNLHYWTAGLGKESFSFLFISTILLAISQQRFFSLSAVLSSILLIWMRPHIAFLLFFAVAFVFVLNRNMSRKQKTIVVISAVGLLSGLFYMVLKLSDINYLDWDRIRYFNEYSLLSFQNSGSYVPIISYSYPYKIFTFYFRPLLFEINTFYGWCLGIENMLVLLLHIVGIGWVFKNYRALSLHQVSRIIIVFVIISGIVVVQRYSGFGIFARTKIMFQPFINLVLLQVLTFKSSYFVKE